MCAELILLDEAQVTGCAEDDYRPKPFVEVIVGSVRRQPKIVLIEQFGVSPCPLSRQFP